MKRLFNPCNGCEYDNIKNLCVFQGGNEMDCTYYKRKMLARKKRILKNEK